VRWRFGFECNNKVVILANQANRDSGGSVDQIRWMYLFGSVFSNYFAPIALWILSMLTWGELYLVR
jgi:hypothetical protein